MSDGEPSPSPGPSVDDLSDRSPGASDQQVYDDIDVEALPEWWQDAIALFEERDMRPYQPARFADGEFVHTVVDDIESTYDVSISFRCLNATEGDDWTVLVDWSPIGKIGRYRSTEGYTVYEIEADEFSEWISGQLVVD